MLSTPLIPQGPAPTWGSILAGFPLQVDLSPIALAVVLVLVCILFAAVSIVLVYHWRRFPFEQEVFDRVEKVYMLVSGILLAISVLAIVLS